MATIARSDFPICRIAATLLGTMAEKARKACELVGSQSDAGEVVADAETLVRLLQEQEAKGGDCVLSDRALVARLARGFRLHAKEIQARMEWEQANLFTGSEHQTRLDRVNALVALCEGREAKAA